MKKNKTMRLASGLLVLTLLSTCAISGTFAKYTTTTSASDTVRVAKWGVLVATETNLFSESYETNTSNTFGYKGNSVLTSVPTPTQGDTKGEDIVAPGTSGSMTFSITGTPEVAVNVAVTLEADSTTLSMITLPKKNGYSDYTTSPAGTFNQSSDYYPIKWTLKRYDTNPATDTSLDKGWESVTGSNIVVNKGNLQAIQNYLSANTLSKNYDPNTVLDNTFGYYQLSWEWEYSVDDDTDKADTYLGQVAADIVQDNTVTLKEAFNLKITVTQID